GAAAAGQCRTQVAVLQLVGAVRLQTKQQERGSARVDGDVAIGLEACGKVPAGSPAIAEDAGGVAAGDRLLERLREAQAHSRCGNGGADDADGCRGAEPGIGLLDLEREYLA